MRVAGSDGGSPGGLHSGTAAAIALGGLVYGSALVWLASGLSAGLHFGRYSAALLPDLILRRGPTASAETAGRMTPAFWLWFAALTAASGLVAVRAGQWWRRRRRPVRRGVVGRADHAGPGDLAGLRVGRIEAVGRAARGRVRPRPPRREAPPPRFRIGTLHRRALWSSPDDHLLVLGPTGAGKSSAFAVPAVLEWPGPVVVTDPKGELVARTLGHRERLGRAAVFAPMLAPTDRWNPVDAISTGDDALRTAGLLMGRAPDRDPFWHDLARQLLHGLLVEAAVARLTLGDCLRLLQEIPAEELPDALAHPVARRIARGALAGGDRTAMGVVATCIAQLGPFGAEQVVATTSASDFDPAGIADGRLRTLYCVVTPHDAILIRGLVGALLSCAWRACFAAPPRPSAAFVLDEFAQLAHLPELPALAQLGRSQGVRLCLLAQDLASVRATYGAEAASALWSNCRAKLLLAGISEVDLLDQASRLAGTATFHARSGEMGHPPTPTPQPLLHPDDIRRLQPLEALLLHSSAQPAIVRQRRWYGDRRLRRAVRLPVPARARLGPATLVPLAAAGRDRSIASRLSPGFDDPHSRPTQG